MKYPSIYLAEYWCQKGHVVHCLEVSFICELSSDEKVVLCKCDTYVVSDNLSFHQSVTNECTSLLIIDRDFLQ
ncbi:MAG: hypothetical protein WCO43_01480 [Chitinophagia bacterium]